MEQARLFVRIHGDVQGVGFRMFARNEARRLGLKGYVRNAYDGTVEVVAQGDRGSLEIFLDVLREGPAFASVNDVEVDWSQSKGEFTDFGVRF
jgi:acylphosphatase